MVITLIMNISDRVEIKKMLNDAKVIEDNKKEEERLKKKFGPDYERFFPSENNY